MAGLRLEQLTKHYRRGTEVIRALDGVTLSIGAGEFVAVVGRSGSGKTTMLDLIGLLLRPTHGQLLIDEVDTSKLSDSDRAHMRSEKIGFVFQEYNLLSTLNVVENVMLPLRYTKGSRDGRQRALELLDRVDLGDRVKHRPGELSGGQQQRVAIARSMINRPSLILLDEPTGARAYLPTSTCPARPCQVRSLTRASTAPTGKVRGTSSSCTARCRRCRTTTAAAPGCTPQTSRPTRRAVRSGRWRRRSATRRRTSSWRTSGCSVPRLPWSSRRLRPSPGCGSAADLQTPFADPSQHLHKSAES